jgi:hypothetical protein
VDVVEGVPTIGETHHEVGIVEEGEGENRLGRGEGFLAGV